MSIESPTEAPASPLSLTIAAVERDTRIGKDTLRVWERRYGFPQPSRDANGERLYPPDQVERLRHVKRMLDAGHRPGRIVNLSLDELQRLGDGSPVGGSPAARASTDAHDDTEVQRLLRLLRAHDLGALRRALSQALLRVGLERFVIDLAMPLVAEVGQAWARGQLEVFEEHLCSETLETVLRTAMSASPEASAASRPRVVLTTFPFEAHGLGLLMADALFLVHGCTTMNLGRQTPLHDLMLASQAHATDIVALSFSAASNPNQAADSLAELRSRLPAEVEIWAGSPLAALHRRAVDGVLLISSLDAIGPEIERWKAARR
ncbi:transcriptional regulator, MerR family [Leptothrix cholodnii SP-6]|uniref:Transcriptional regulator, MerR family n=1 Tax=Leptothrix cholodnii (strain ATCC 51168 / LMG 8142 / SP-6) TaxID=395495 RepID=B1XXW6_LEPCP|nr:MerR family transcriptional regulator [Leptothrix cholodnii]ACB32735.1 transcriptional regulator, MerR family [Leptothrix cholodnii SP-6]